MKLTSQMPFIDFLYAHSLTGERLAQIDFLAIEAQPAAAGDHHDSIVEGIVRLGDALIRPEGSNIYFRRTPHLERFESLYQTCTRWLGSRYSFCPRKRAARSSTTMT